MLYYPTSDYFDTVGPAVDISNDKLTITKTKDDLSAITCYGHNTILSMSNLIHKWKFRINNQLQCIVIGIDEAPGKCVTGCYYNISKQILSIEWNQSVSTEVFKKYA